MSKEQDKKTALMEFTQKAAQRIRDKRVPKYSRYYVPSIDQEVVIRSLNNDEIQQIVDMEDGTEPDRGDKYAVYIGISEPNMKEAATSIMESEASLSPDQRTLNEALDIVSCFSVTERADLCMAIMELSEVVGGKKIAKVTSDIKN